MHYLKVPSLSTVHYCNLGKLVVKPTVPKVRYLIINLLSCLGTELEYFNPGKRYAVSELEH